MKLLILSLICSVIQILSVFHQPVAAKCLTNAEIDKRLLVFKKQLDGEDVFQAKRSLLAAAKRSQPCRQRVIRALTSAMAQLNDHSASSEAYPLWDNGARLLADLRAIEALDLLIANLGFNDDFTSSLSHYPAVGAVTTIGQAAIPKLEFVLTKDSDPNIRKLAAFCIADIGGSQARSVLAKALPNEKDKCLNNFLRISLKMFANKTRPNHIPSDKENGEWWSAFYCPAE